MVWVFTPALHGRYVFSLGFIHTWKPRPHHRENATTRETIATRIRARSQFEVAEIDFAYLDKYWQREQGLSIDTLLSH